MRNIIVLVAVLAVSEIHAGVPNISELSIGGIEIGATEARVRRSLGEPAGTFDTGEGLELYYPGLVVTVGWLESPGPEVPRRVTALTGTGFNACTPAGLCPGMPVAEVTRLYGPTEPVRRENGTFLEYQPKGANCWLQIRASADPIYKVAVACQP